MSQQLLFRCVGLRPPFGSPGSGYERYTVELSSGIPSIEHHPIPAPAMPYVLTKKESYVHLDWSGTITTQDLKSIGKDLTGVMAEWGYAPHVLHTFDQVEAMDFGPWGMFMHSLLREDTILPNKSKSAHVAKSEKAQSVCKMFRELNRNPDIEMQLFDNEAAAIAWLQSDPPGV